MDNDAKIEATYQMVKEIYDFLIPFKAIVESGMLPGMPAPSGAPSPW